MSAVSKVVIRSWILLVVMHGDLVAVSGQLSIGREEYRRGNEPLESRLSTFMQQIESLVGYLNDRFDRLEDNLKQTQDSVNSVTRQLLVFSEEISNTTRRECGQYNVITQNITKSIADHDDVVLKQVRDVIGNQSSSLSDVIHQRTSNLSQRTCSPARRRAWPNSALHRPTSSSSVIKTDQNGWSTGIPLVTYRFTSSSNVVDGNLDSNHFHASCFHSDNGDTNPWLSVDLGTAYCVQHVVVTNRGECCGSRMNNFIVGLSNIAPVPNAPLNVTYTLCGQWPGVASDGQHMTVTCSPGLIAARYVIIMTNVEYMNFCELQVFSTDF